MRSAVRHVLFEGRVLDAPRSPMSRRRQPGRVTPVQPAGLTALKAIGVAVSSALCVTLFVRIVVAFASGASAWLVLPPCVLGYLFADLVSGHRSLVFATTFLKEDTPVFGKLVIQPFRDHHLHPQRITHCMGSDHCGPREA